MHVTCVFLFVRDLGPIKLAKLGRPNFPHFRNFARLCSKYEVRFNFVVCHFCFFIQHEYHYRQGARETQRQGTKETPRRGTRETQRQGTRETQRQGTQETQRQGTNEARRNGQGESDKVKGTTIRNK